MISVVICSIDQAKLTAALQTYARLLGGQPYEIIHVPDARGLAEGYNRGLARSRGELIIFSHDDVEFHCQGFLGRLVGHMGHCDLLGIAGTDRASSGAWLSSGPPHVFGQIIHSRADPGGFRVLLYNAPARRVLNIQSLDGVFLCCKREVAQKIGFDQQTFQRYHMYDSDFSFRAYLAGCRLAVACDLDAVHAALSQYDYSFMEDEA
jgi:GT2 family glycosyltransferase